MKDPAEDSASIPVAEDMPGSQNVLYCSIAELQKAQNALLTANADLARRLADLGAINARLEAQNTDLRASNVRLRTDKVELRASNSRLEAENADLRALSAHLQAQNADLAAFAHTVAHDLKNPVSQVMAFADFLCSYFHMLSAQQLKDALHAILRASAKMNSIIEELLLLSQIGEAEVELEPLYMPAIVQEALGRVDQLIEELEARVSVPDVSGWPRALGQRAWIEEVWVNYLSNALKYGGCPPHVRITAQLQPDGLVRFSVQDNGPGLTEEEQHRLFVPFERVGQVRATGYGLGLSIVRRIVEKLHGQVAIDSRPGEGSIFSFTLPAAPQE